MSRFDHDPEAVLSIEERAAMVDGPGRSAAWRASSTVKPLSRAEQAQLLEQRWQTFKANCNDAGRKRMQWVEDAHRCANLATEQTRETLPIDAPSWYATVQSMVQDSGVSPLVAIEWMRKLDERAEQHANLEAIHSHRVAPTPTTVPQAAIDAVAGLLGRLPATQAMVASGLPRATFWRYAKRARSTAPAMILG